jgi:hypothetical protein
MNQPPKMPRNQRLAIPCEQCLQRLTTIINSPYELERALIQGFLFHWCKHRNVHACWAEDGHLTMQHCASEAHGVLINGAFVSASEFHRKHLASLLAQELARTSTPRSHDAKANDDDDRTVLHA